MTAARGTHACILLVQQPSLHQDHVRRRHCIWQCHTPAKTRATHTRNRSVLLFSWDGLLGGIALPCQGLQNTETALTDHEFDSTARHALLTHFMHAKTCAC